MRVRPRVFEYYDVNLFLKDYLLFLNGETGITPRQVAKDSGLTEAYMSMMLSGKRSISSKILRSMKKPLGLEPKEFEHLKNLADLKKVMSLDAIKEKVKNFQRRRHYNGQSEQEKTYQDYMTTWLNVLIREMASMKGFKANAEKIREQIPFLATNKEINTSLEFLLENGFIQVIDGGVARASDINIECTPEVQGQSLAKFHKNMLNLASRSISEIDRDQRDLTVYILPASKESFPQIKEAVDEFIAKLKKIEDSNPAPDTIYQVGINAFPLADVGPTEEDNKAIEPDLEDEDQAS